MKKFNHLKLSDREVIQKRLDSGFKQVRIAEELNVDPSTISREIKRNSGNEYFCVAAHRFATEKRKSANQRRKKIFSPKLKWYVLKRLIQQWTPEDISNRLKKVHPFDRSKWISAETIYQWIFEYKEKGIYLNKFLLRKNKKYSTRGKKGRKLDKNQKKTSIHDRPTIINDRKRLGDWEGDTVVGSQRSGFIASFIERKSRFYITAKLENLKAENFNVAIRDQFAFLDNERIRSFTFDNGTEMSAFEQIEEFMNCKVYFTDPGSPWQKGQVENIHRILRYYFPKKSNFKDITQEKLDKVTHRINQKPRKCLGYRNPYEAFHGLPITDHLALRI